MYLICNIRYTEDMFGKDNIYWKVENSWNFAQLNQSDSISHVTIRNIWPYSSVGWSCINMLNHFGEHGIVVCWLRSC